MTVSRTTTVQQYDGISQWREQDKACARAVPRAPASMESGGHTPTMHRHYERDSVSGDSATSHGYTLAIETQRWTRWIDTTAGAATQLSPAPG